MTAQEPPASITYSHQSGFCSCQLGSQNCQLHSYRTFIVQAGNTKGGSITVPLTSCLTGLDQSVLQIKTKIVSSHTADSKPFKQEVNGTVILPPLVFPGIGITHNDCHIITLYVYSTGHYFIKINSTISLQRNKYYNKCCSPKGNEPYYEAIYGSNCCSIVVSQSVCKSQSLQPQSSNVN